MKPSMVRLSVRPSGGEQYEVERADRGVLRAEGISVGISEAELRQLSHLKINLNQQFYTEHDISL
jgi:hypothetical protein